MPSQNLRCNQCGAYQVFRSTPRSLIEKYVLPVLLLRPVRCGHCFRRNYRMVFYAQARRGHSLGEKRRAA